MLARRVLPVLAMAAPARATPPKLPEKRDDGLIDASAGEWMPDAEVQADNDAEAPSSRIRLSAPPNAALSFKVYTLAELERRSDAPVSMRLSRVAFESLPRRRDEKWRATWSAFRALAGATLRWAKTKNELGLRYPLKATIWPELDSFGNAAQVAVDAVDWKKHGVTLGIVVGATFTLFFAVLLCAEMTDDLKPSAHLAPASALEVSPPTHADIPSPRAVWAPAEPAAPTDEGDAIDAPPAARPPPRARAKAKGKLTFRNADAIFNP